jgi:hypothetical protein
MCSFFGGMWALLTFLYSRLFFLWKKQLISLLGTKLLEGGASKHKKELKETKAAVCGPNQGTKETKQP